MDKNSVSIGTDRSPHASLGNDEADQAGTCFSVADFAGLSQSEENFSDSAACAGKKSATIDADSSPRASLGNDEADQAGTLLSGPIAVTYPELYDRLVSRGLSFCGRSQDEAVNLLQSVGYYHLRGYWITLEDGEGFLDGSTINHALDIMHFDEDLAEFILAATTPIELTLRSALSQTLVEHAGAFALENRDLFSNESFYRQMNACLSREQKQGKRNKSTFVLQNLEKYNKLPVWAAMELTSLGTASKIFRNLASKDLSSEISGAFGTRPRYLKNWLRCVTAIRNMSVHHDRMYNRMFSTLPALHKEYARVDRSRLFAQMIVLLRLHDAVRPSEAGSIRLRLNQIVEAHSDVDLRPVGFPEDWREILGIPTCPSQEPRARGRKGGRPPKDETAVEEALFLYDMKTDSISEICRKTGVGSTTLYKYINLRKEEQG